MPEKGSANRQRTKKSDRERTNAEELGFIRTESEGIDDRWEEKGKTINICASHEVYKEHENDVRGSH